MTSIFLNERQTNTQIKNNFTEEGKRFVSIIQGSFVFKNHFCIVIELLGMDLFHVLTLRNYTGLQMRLMRSVLTSLLTAIAELHANDLMHSDIKPENICINSDSSSIDVKLIDFGSAMCVSQQSDHKLYVESRYYRAPEVILHIPYTSKIDIWAIGCVAMELFCGLPLFPGQNEEHMISLFDQYLGPFPHDFICMSPLYNKYFEDDAIIPVNEVLARSGKPPVDTGSYFEYPDIMQTIISYQRPPMQNSPEYIDRCNLANFIFQCLTLDPQQRPDARSLLSHPFFTPSPR